MCKMLVLCVMCVCLFVYGCDAQSNSTVNVVRIDLAYDQQHTLAVNNSVEYIVQFSPNAAQREWPSRVWVRVEGGDTSRPLLVTARQTSGAVTWQLPHRAGSQLWHELTRVLCAAAAHTLPAPGCEEASPPGAFSLHIGSSCAASQHVSLRVSSASHLRLRKHQPLTVQATQASPGTLFYQWESQDSSVRLVASSPDDACALLAIHNYTCPLATTQAEAQAAALRMSMLRAGAVQLSRKQFPYGFFVVVLVLDSDRVCVGAPPEQTASWLWDDALFHKHHLAEQLPPHVKQITVQIEAALSRGGYVWACVATLAVFVACYVLCGALVLAQRWPPLRALTRPKAVLANYETEADAAASRSPLRRLSTATFDSSDNSDSDDDNPPVTPSTITTIHTTITTLTTTHPTTTHSITNTTNSHSTDANHDNVREASNHVNRTSNISSINGTGHNTSDTDGGGGDGIADGNEMARGDVNNEEVHTTQTDNTQQPFGLPASLRLAALSRRRARTVRARSDRYLYTLGTVSVFYALPVVQFVIAFQVFLNVSGSLDMCYYNYLCAHPAGALSDFNHVFSNLGYLLLGALFCLQLQRRRNYRKRHPKNEEYGIPAHYGLLTSLGVGMMVVAVLSASYHLCPNRLNFQFDTAFMYVLAVISMVKIYQSRHPDVNARAHATFGILAVIIALGVWGVLGGGAVFWALLTVLHVFTFLLLSLSVYYLGQFRLEKNSLVIAASSLKPLYVPQMILLLLANALNWAFALYGLVQQPADFASHLLSVLLGNTLLYMMFYVVMKLVSGERLRWYSWCFLAGATLAWVPGLYFFVSGSSMWSTTPALSRHYNRDCMVMQFYDTHDLWHFLSAFGLYLTFNAMLTWDDGLSAVKRTDIAVF